MNMSKCVCVCYLFLELNNTFSQYLYQGLCPEAITKHLHRNGLIVTMAALQLLLWLKGIVSSQAASVEPSACGLTHHHSVAYSHMAQPRSSAHHHC